MIWRKTKNYFFITILTLSGIAVLIPLILIIIYVIKMGFSSLNWQFITHLPRPVGESGGGMAHAIVGTLFLVGLGGIFSIPLGIMLGTYLSEFKKDKMAKFLRHTIDLLFKYAQGNELEEHCKRLSDAIEKVKPLALKDDWMSELRMNAYLDEIKTRKELGA